MRRHKAIDEAKMGDSGTDMSSMKEICFNQASTRLGNIIQLLNAIDVSRTTNGTVHKALSEYNPLEGTVIRLECLTKKRFDNRERNRLILELIRSGTVVCESI